MAGLSSRFYKAGYTKPKYMLSLYGISLFKHSVKSFENYFETERFIFILRDVEGVEEFIKKEIKDLGILNFDVVLIKGETRGQAETVYLGLSNYRECNEHVTVFNIDTFRPGFVYPDLEKKGDGYLEVFIGSGDNWSFVRPVNKSTTLIDLTAEKNPISNYCCTGLYHFRKCTDYFAAYDYYSNLSRDCWDKGELYVAPLYNYLIKKGRNIHFHLINREDVIFCGTPKEYEEAIITNYLTSKVGE